MAFVTGKNVFFRNYFRIYKEEADHTLNMACLFHYYNYTGLQGPVAPSFFYTIPWMERKKKTPVAIIRHPNAA